MADQLLTLFHISDLHVGTIEPRATKFDARMAKSWRFFTPLLGYLGHTGIALRQLEDAWSDVLDEDPNARVVVTGDLTATGAADQYVAALTYLHSKLYDPTTGTLLGLGHQTPALIPGNHDHWPGNDCRGISLAVCMQGSATPTFAKVFPARPPALTRIPLKNGCTVVLAGLDSDADVPSVGLMRFAARGSFVGQCGDVTRQLGIPNRNELRVLLLHHSSITKDVPAYTLRIDSRSRRALVKLVREAGIAIVLTGHQHRPDFALPMDNSDVVEARCGTTTCRDFFDDTFDTGGILRRNSLLVHRLFGDKDGGIEWWTEILERRGYADKFDVVKTIRFGPLWRP